MNYLRLHYVLLIKKAFARGELIKNLECRHNNKKQINEKKKKKNYVDLQLSGILTFEGIVLVV